MKHPRTRAERVLPLSQITVHFHLLSCGSLWMFKSRWQNRSFFNIINTSAKCRSKFPRKLAGTDTYSFARRNFSPLDLKRFLFTKIGRTRMRERGKIPRGNLGRRGVAMVDFSGRKLSHPPPYFKYVGFRHEPL